MESTTVQENRLMTVSAVEELIKDGRKLVLSAEEELLNQLPKGNWIGATIPYFYLKGESGRMDKTMIMVTDFSDLITDFNIRTYNEQELQNIGVNGYENGFNFLILPALKSIHLSFALNAKDYEDLYKNPLIGIVAGVDLEEFAKGRESKTFNGQTGEAHSTEGVALHAELPSNKVARIEIVNVFEQDNQLTVEVESDGFSVGDCLINGEKKNLYDYVKENDLDIRNPLTLNKGGAIVNVAFQRLDDDNKEVVFYAPLFKGETYQYAKPIGKYSDAFNSKVGEVMESEKAVAYNCNCILNYVYGELDKSGDLGFTGATVFGEIAYTLLTQTFTYLAIDEA